MERASWQREFEEREARAAFRDPFPAGWTKKKKNAYHWWKRKKEQDAIKESDPSAFRKIRDEENRRHKQWRQRNPGAMRARSMKACEKIKIIRREGGEAKERYDKAHREYAAVYAHRRKGDALYVERRRTAAIIYYSKKREDPAVRWASLLDGAVHRRLKVAISFERACELLKEVCAYCHSRGSIGVDRVNSSVGYEKTNLVACCKTCNRMKSDADVTAFLSKCGHVRDTFDRDDRRALESESNLPCTTHYRCPNVAWNNYVRSARLRGYSWDLDRKEFLALLDRPCRYCRRARGGVDRLVNEIGYTPSNSVPCCSLCNSMKGTMSESAFVSHCVTVANVTQLGNQ